jgi:predicted MFS family arabinose efflux permease
VRTLPERALLLLMASVQFTHIMDFMIMMPLGPQLMRELHISPAQFSSLVAAYTVSSGVTGLFTAPFIDRFDRRAVLLVAYAGFIFGTIACALSHHFVPFLAARAVSGAFGGLSGAMVISIISDAVPPARRGAAIGLVMTAFSVAAALGIPFGLQLAQRLRWEAPFIFVATLGMVMWVIGFLGLPPMRGHLAAGGIRAKHAFSELLRDANAGRAILFMSALVFGHFAIIPLLSPHLVANVGLPEKHLFLVYFTGGVCSVFTAPLVGKLVDAYGRVRVLAIMIAVACVVTLLLAHPSPKPLWAVLTLSGLFFTFASGRFVPGQTIMTLAVPPSRRGAYMSLSGCARDLTMGFTSTIGGWIVNPQPNGRLAHYEWLGWLAVGAGILSIWLGSRVKVNDRGLETAPADLSAAENRSATVA